MGDAEGVLVADDGVGAAFAGTAGVLDVAFAIERLEQENARALELGAVELLLERLSGGGLDGGQYLGQAIDRRRRRLCSCVQTSASSSTSGPSESMFHMRDWLRMVWRRRAETASSNGWIGRAETSSTGRTCP